jgi:hypothetical protein
MYILLSIAIQIFGLILSIHYHRAPDALQMGAYHNYSLVHGNFYFV